jgi:phosphopantetheine--protein transferase-like protein
MLGVGIDIINIDRMRQILNRDDGSFLNRIFTKKEISYSKKFNDQAEYFSRIFAFKESFVKAKGCGFRNVKPNDIEVRIYGGLKPPTLQQENIRAYFKRQRIDLIDIVYLRIENNIICSLIINSIKT